MNAVQSHNFYRICSIIVEMSYIERLMLIVFIIAHISKTEKIREHHCGARTSYHIFSLLQMKVLKRVFIMIEFIIAQLPI